MGVLGADLRGADPGGADLGGAAAPAGGRPPDPTDGRRARLTAILAKRPLPGRVKTRLVPPLAPEEAAALAEALLADLWDRMHASPAFATRLLAAPPEEAGWFRARFPGARVEPQRGAGLAERLAAWFEDALAEPAARTAVALGADLPLVAAARVEEAHRRLEAGADLVVGPDEGGGYYLIGMRRPHPALFLEVPMSTPDMAAATVALARARGLAVELLPPELDVDVAADLDRLRDELARRPPEGRPPRTAALLAGLGAGTGR